MSSMMIYIGNAFFILHCNSNFYSSSSSMSESLPPPPAYEAVNKTSIPNNSDVNWYVCSSCSKMIFSFILLYIGKHGIQN